VIRVLVADDQALVRLGLKVLLESEDDLELVGEAEHGKAAAELARRERPVVVLMDIRMPVMDGIEALRAIVGDPGLRDTRVIMLTTFELDEYVFESLRTRQRASEKRQSRCSAHGSVDSATLARHPRYDRGSEAQRGANPRGRDRRRSPRPPARAPPRLTRSVRWAHPAPRRDQDRSSLRGRLTPAPASVTDGTPGLCGAALLAATIRRSIVATPATRRR
jgi:CheY-like chemotaxis protein